MDRFENNEYARTLRFFEAYYPYDNEDVHYADVILSMNQCKSIDEMLPIYERVKSKIDKIDKQYVNKIPNKLSKELAECESSVLSWNTVCFEKLQTRLRSDIGNCFDDNIVRLFKEIKNITLDICGECFVNLNQCWDYSKQKDMIIQEAMEKANLDVTDLFITIKKRKEKLPKHLLKFHSFKEGMNGYQPAKQAVIDDLAFLLQYNWRMSSTEKSAYYDFLPKTKDIKNNKNKLADDQVGNKTKSAFLEQYNWRTSPGEIWAYRDNPPKVELDKDKNKKKEDKIFNIISVVVALIFVIVLISTCTGSCSSNPDDHTGENWLLLILLLLLYLKGK